MSKRQSRAYVGLLVSAIGLASSACTVGGGGGTQPPDDQPVIGASAGGQTNIISDGWEEASVRGGNNIKFLNFTQMQAEMLRATSINYDKWEANRNVFGAADFRSSFEEDRTPTTTKIMTWRKIAFAVCGQMIKKEMTTPNLFASISPAAAIDIADSKVVDQVKAVFTKFFFDPPSSKELEMSTKALAATIAAGGKPSEAWANLCVAYLSSMRFLTY